MHQSIRCQIVRGIHCSTQHAEYHHCSTSRRGEEPSAVVRVVLLLEPHGGASVLLFFISDKVHVYSGEGRKTAAQHVMNDIDQPCSNISWPPCEPVCVFSLLVSLKERRVGSLPSIEIGLLTLLSHMSVICQEEVRWPTGHTRTWFCTFILLLPPSQFTGRASLWCISLNAFPPPERL